MTTLRAARFSAHGCLPYHIRARSESFHPVAGCGYSHHKARSLRLVLHDRAGNNDSP